MAFCYGNASLSNAIRSSYWWSADFSALKFTKYNQYESLVLPMVEYLKSHGVQFEYDVKVEDIKVDVTTSQKLPRNINSPTWQSRVN